ncbi:MAG: hypothetical protein Q9174_001067 [Haloplaca sp. 1 TL-2023]
MSGGFTVPFSSSPPSTPDSRQPNGRGRTHGLTSFGSHPSTTPAGPPPSSASSFTPAGPPPPSSIFGDSTSRSKTKLFSSKQSSSNGILPRPHPQKKVENGMSIPRNAAPSTSTSLLGSTPLKHGPKGRTFTVPASSSLIDITANKDDQEWSDDDMEEADDEDDDLPVNAPLKARLRDDSPASRNHSKSTPFKTSVGNGSLISPGGIDWARSDFGSSFGAGTPRSTKRPRDSIATSNALSRQKPPAKRQKKESAIPGIIKNMSTRLGTAKLQESDDFISGSESCLGAIYRDGILPEDEERKIKEALPFATKGLCNLWRAHGKQAAADWNLEDNLVEGIGPKENATPLQKATFIAPLLLQIHHPPPTTGKQALAPSQSFRSSRHVRSHDLSNPPIRAKPLPKLLHDWLEEYHNPWKFGVELQFYTPNPTANPNYWDLLLNMLLRGKFSDVLDTLKASKFQFAHSAKEDSGSIGYSGATLENITTLVCRMARLLEKSPAIREDNWDITGAEWGVFRKSVDQALAQLTSFMEGKDGVRDAAMHVVEAPHFGLGSSTSTFEQSLQSSARNVPSIICENLKTAYGILLGKPTEIISSAQDWVEATIGLTIWWDGDDDDGDGLATDFGQSRRSMAVSQHRNDRMVDLNPTTAYIRRLASAFDRVTDEDDPDLFQIDSNNAIEIALASIFEDNVEGVITLLHCWSIPVASAIAEIANLGGWLKSSGRLEQTHGFDQEDLLVLSYAQPDQGLNSDLMLVEYAYLLFEREAIKASTTEDQQERWEMSIQILARLDDDDLGTKKAGELMLRVPMTSDKRVDKVIRLCRGTGLDEEASSIAEQYADYFTNETDRYGNALIYYARARLPDKVKSILDLLVSLCVVESKAFPPYPELDSNLRALIEHPKESLTALSNLDAEAAQMIHHQMTGYAALRKFYDLRDVEVMTDSFPIPNLRPAARRKAAIRTLMAVVNSAADNIHGGLYDPDRGSIVPVDGLLALLGEASVFLDQPQRELSLSQCFDLLKAIEDLQTVTSGVYEQCEECFHCTLANAQSQQQKLADRREMFKKSISNVTTSSSAFSLVDSMMESETRESTGSDGVMVRMVDKANGSIDNGDKVSSNKIKRGWDWRDGLDADTSAAGLLRRLRLGLAKDIARAWVDGEES